MHQEVILTISYYLRSKIYKAIALLVKKKKQTNLPANTGDVRDVGSIPGLERSPGEGNGNPLQYSCLEIPQTEDPGELQSIGLQRVGMTEAT